MELRYMGFDQSANTRLYRFDKVAKGVPPTEVIMSVDMALFFKHHVGVQEGPALCAHKLNTEEECLASGELTDADFRAFADARSASIAAKSELKRRGGRGARPQVAAAPGVFRKQD